MRFQELLVVVAVVLVSLTVPILLLVAFRGVARKSRGLEWGYAVAGASGR